MAVVSSRPRLPCYSDVLWYNVPWQLYVLYNQAEPKSVKYSSKQRKVLRLTTQAYSVPADQFALVLCHPHRWEANAENLHFPSLDDTSARLNADGREFRTHWRSFSSVSSRTLDWSWCKKMLSASSNMEYFMRRKFQLHSIFFLPESSSLLLSVSQSAMCAIKQWNQPQSCSGKLDF